MLETLGTFGPAHAYALALAALWGARGVGRKWRSQRSLAAVQAAEDRGASEPLTLHPFIDPDRCIGCGACTHACPEGRVIGLLDGTATLVDPASCIGHGACRDVCPAGAITLVLGTPERGIDIPTVNASMATTVPGLYIAGELAGAGLIANAIEEGQRAIATIARMPRRGDRHAYDVVIIGAGPAGFAASLAAAERGLAYVTLEQAAFAGAVAQYPRGKLVMTRPVRLPHHGRVRARRIRKEKLLGLWQRISREAGLEIHTGERVHRILTAATGFVVETPSRRYETHNILLATGRRGTPRTLDVPGETLPNVAYRLVEPARYAGRRVVVAGGGDSAIEAALALARRGDVAVTLMHRRERFERAKPANIEKLTAAEAAGKLSVLREAAITAIAMDRVTFAWRGRPHALPNDDVIVCIGGRLPTEMLQALGVEVVTKFGTP